MNRQSLGLIFCMIILGVGCDKIYGVLQKEGAQEKELVGTVVPYESNEKVKQIQKLLKLYGYKIGRADGALGANTRNSVSDFQKDHGLEVTHFVDNATWQKLNIFAHYGLVVDGEVNIYGVQMALKEAGFKLGKLDGKMGNQTVEVIKKFQKAKGLKPDGKIGYNTLQALSDYLQYQEF